ncbi:ScyD/ScyE family protein [Cellulomonas sp. H30R-01]|uniref:ScyD/ScyE family protein n=1 Tax=Cellulomonas sp. H30R-01 TaxID=2704467 RepID=UPI00138BBB1A|nr:ScyD/ScyE family protein [Cellulomonas sp. H30R-01]QHT55225.1 ScyD/ScyE family protein [Cellulomonas sp. H30R-01]
MGPRRLLLLLGSALLLALVPTTASAHHPSPGTDPVRVVTGLGSGMGSTIGPDGALYVASPASGVISRVDPRTGAVTTFASGLPTRPAGGGGVFDVAFRGRTAYALVTFVSADVGGSAVDGIYRIDGPSAFTVVADIGAFATANPPATDFFVPTGVQFAFEPYRDGFLVSDGHHNRIYQVRHDGTVSVRLALANVVPTGLALKGSTVFVAESGPLPHLPQDGKVVAFGPRASSATTVAAGGPLMVDVERAGGNRLYALAQGDWPLGGEAGSPAAPGTGRLYSVDHHGTLRLVADGLDQPTSFQVVHGTAWVVTLGGEVWRVGLGR